MKQLYFDHAAATPVSKKVLAAMQPYFSERFYNPSALYLAAQDVKQAITGARERVARILGAKSKEIIFTSGGTEANNLAIHGIMQKFPDASIVTTAIEHESVLAPAGLYAHKIAPVKPDGRLDIKLLASLIDDKTVLVSVMYANNEIGTVQPLHEIAKLLKEIRENRRKANKKLPLYFHTDAAQAGNYLSLLVHSLGVDMMTLNGGKIYGPKQSGVLFVRTSVELAPQILGGGQERKLRSGTENVPAIIGFAEALRESSNMREAESERLVNLRQRFLSDLSKTYPDAQLNGSLSHRLPNNVHLTIPGVDNERLMMELDEQGIMVATGSACSASSDEPSHVLRAIGLSDEAARSSLRITFGRETDEADVDKLGGELVRALK